MPSDFHPNAQQIADLEAAIQAIMKTWRVPRDQAIRILTNEEQPPSQYPPGSPEELLAAVAEIARVYGVSNDVAAKMLRGEIPYPGDQSGQNTYRPPAPPGYAWAYNPTTTTYELVDTTPLDPTAPLEGWKWVLGDPKDPSSGEWKFFPSKDILDNPYRGVPPAVLPWLQYALANGGNLELVPEGPARAWVQYLLSQAGRQQQPGDIPFGLGVPGFGTPEQPITPPSASAPQPPSPGGTPVNGPPEPIGPAVSGPAPVLTPGEITRTPAPDRMELLEGVRSAYNTRQGDAAYRPEYDLNHDGVIDTSDLILAAHPAPPSAPTKPVPTAGTPIGTPVNSPPEPIGPPMGGPVPTTPKTDPSPAPTGDNGGTPTGGGPTQLPPSAPAPTIPPSPTPGPVIPTGTETPVLHTQTPSSAPSQPTGFYWNDTFWDDAHWTRSSGGVPIYKMAGGGSFVANSPQIVTSADGTPVTFGEAGAERIDVTPLGTPKAQGAPATQGVQGLPPPPAPPGGGYNNAGRAGFNPSNFQSTPVSGPNTSVDLRSNYSPFDPNQDPGAYSEYLQFLIDNGYLVYGGPSAAATGGGTGDGGGTGIGGETPAPPAPSSSGVFPRDPSADSRVDPQGNRGGGTGSRDIPIRDARFGPSTGTGGVAPTGQALYYVDANGQVQIVANPDLTPEQIAALGGTSGILNTTTHVFEPLSPEQIDYLNAIAYKQALDRLIAQGTGDPEVLRRLAEQQLGPPPPSGTSAPTVNPNTGQPFTPKEQAYITEVKRQRDSLVNPNTKKPFTPKEKAYINEVAKQKGEAPVFI